MHQIQIFRTVFNHMPSGNWTLLKTDLERAWNFSWKVFPVHHAADNSYTVLCNIIVLIYNHTNIILYFFSYFLKKKILVCWVMLILCDDFVFCCCRNTVVQWQNILLPLHQISSHGNLSIFQFLLCSYCVVQFLFVFCLYRHWCIRILNAGASHCRPMFN